MALQKTGLLSSSRSPANGLMRTSSLSPSNCIPPVATTLSPPCANTGFGGAPSSPGPLGGLGSANIFSICSGRPSSIDSTSGRRRSANHCRCTLSSGSNGSGFVVRSLVSGSTRVMSTSSPVSGANDSGPIFAAIFATLLYFVRDGSSRNASRRSRLFLPNHA